MKLLLDLQNGIYILEPDYRVKEVRGGVFMHTWKMAFIILIFSLNP